MGLKIALAAVLAFHVAAADPARAQSRILVDQVGKARAGTARIAQPHQSSPARVTAPARPGANPSRQDGVSPLAESCARAAAAGGPVPAECATSRRQEAEAAAQKPTPEGTLLYLFGRQDSPTRSTTEVARNGSDADAVARELGSEAAGSAVTGDVAAIAARQRQSPGPSPPR